MPRNRVTQLAAALAFALAAFGAVSLLAPRSAPSPAPAATAPRWTLTDSQGDGTPDFLSLHHSADRRAFRDWFRYLAEAQFHRPGSSLPPDVRDCSGLLRYAYREALRRHDSHWAAGLNLTHLPALPAVAQYNYPFTPLGASLFRVRPGPFTPADLKNGAFAEFADAETLMRYNTWRVARSLERAQPGDLLFFHQPGQNMPFHAMVYLGESLLDPSPQSWIVYHTGPTGGGPGEVRRPSAPELLAHREPRWRPVSSNSHFLGVYRWNILGD